MNITLSAEADVVERTREYARLHGTSLNELIRDFMLSLTERTDRDQAADEFVRNATANAGRSPKGYRSSRDDAQRSGGRA